MISTETLVHVSAEGRVTVNLQGATLRESIGHAYGLQSYADVMTHFATAERYLNRCWSASTDGYIDEVHTYLTRARDQFTQALDLLRTHTTQGVSQPK